MKLPCDITHRSTDTVPVPRSENWGNPHISPIITLNIDCPKTIIEQDLVRHSMGASAIIQPSMIATSGLSLGMVRCRKMAVANKSKAVYLHRSLNKHCPCIQARCRYSNLFCIGSNDGHKEICPRRLVAHSLLSSLSSSFSFFSSFCLA